VKTVRKTIQWEDILVPIVLFSVVPVVHLLVSYFNYPQTP